MSNFIDTIRNPGEIQALKVIKLTLRRARSWDCFQLQMVSTDRSVLGDFLWPKSFQVARNTGKDSDSIS